MDIFKMTDGVGQTLTVEPTIIGGYAARVTLARPGWIRVTLLRAEDVDRLREVLAPLGTQREAAPLTIEVGREYRLLPGARYHAGHNSYPAARALAGATRVCVLRERDDDGDHWVRLLDGERRGECAYVGAQYLAPLDDDRPARPGNPLSAAANMGAALGAALRRALAPEPRPEQGPMLSLPASAIEVGREYRVLPGAGYRLGGRPYAISTLRDGAPRARVTAGPDDDGDYHVSLPNEASQWVSPEYLAPLDDETPEPEPPADLDPLRVAALRCARGVAGPDALPEDVQSFADWLIGRAR